jgi:hypothetical protein
MKLTSSQKIAFATVTAAYLLFELAFNAKLVDVAGGIPTKLQITDLELHGGLVSAAGASVLIWRLICSLRNISGRWLVSSLILTGMVIGPAVFLGQRAAVAHVASSASPDEMKRAVVSATVAKAMQRCVAVIKGLDINCDESQTPEWKTFNALLTSLSYVSGSLLNSATAKADSLVVALAEVEAGSAASAYQKEYAPKVNELRRRFNGEYRDASKKMAETAVQVKDPEEAWVEYQRELNAQAFTAESANEQQRSAVIDRLHKRGVKVSAGWSLDDKVGFIQGLPQNNANSEFRRRADEILGARTSIQPGLAWESFSAHPDVQRYIKDQLNRSGTRFKIPEGKLDLDADQNRFATTMFKPAVQVDVKRALDKMQMPLASYEKNGKNYSDGFDAMRAVIVPPLAMSFSLFFGLLNLISLVGQILPISTLGSLAVRSALLAAAIGLPLLVNNKVTNSVAYNTIENAIHTELPVMSFGISWVIRAEPIFYGFVGKLRRANM